MFSVQVSLFAWASVERHILIFHDQWVSTKRKRFFVHYFPIIFIIIYYTIFYSFGYFSVPCSYSFDGYLAGRIYISCAFNKKFLLTWELFIHQSVPTVVIELFSIGLIFRVLRQRVRMRQSIKWAKQRKMTIQLVSLSTIYMLFNTPWIAVMLAYQFDVSWNALAYWIVSSKFILYNIVFLFPFICLLSLRDLRVKMKKILECRNSNQVAPPAVNNANRR